MSETLRIADENFKKALEELREAEEGSVEWYKALLKRDKAVFQRSRSNMVQEIHDIRNRKDKEIDAIRSYVTENLLELQEMIDKCVDHKNIVSKIETIINNVLYDEF